MSIKKKIVWLPYDMDTAIGINNEGALVFDYELEDIDHLEGGANVFNGQDSVIWKNIRAAFGDELAAMYRTLRSQGKLSYEKVERMFEEHQGKWPEAIFNEDSWFKYIDPLIEDGSGAYLSMMQGSKAEQRKWWLYNRFRYIDSKYNAGDALSDLIQLRGYAKSDITVTPYADIYPSVKYGSYLVQLRGKRGVASTLICPLDSVNDTEIYIYSSSQLASVGDLSGLKVGFADFSMATKLQDIKLGDSNTLYVNPNLTSLTLGNNVLLKTIDVRNCTGLGTGDQKSVDLSGCTGIENVYFDGTAIAGVTLPNGGVLKKLHLPDTITNLTIMNQKAITELIANVANLTTLRLENVSSVVNIKSIVNSIPTGCRVRLIGFTLEFTDAEEIDAFLDTLDMMRGLDEQGGNVEQAQVSGTIHTSSLTGAEIAEFQSRYPFITFDADYVESTLTFKSWDGATMLKTVTCLNGVPQESAPSIPARADSSDGHYSYTAVGWNKNQDAQTDDPSAIINVTADTIVYTAYSRTVKTYTVYWDNYGGTNLETDLSVPWGTVPHYDSATPTYDGQTSTGWLPDPTQPITGNVHFVAQYLPVYTVTFKNDTGSTTLDTQNVVQGQTAVYGGTTPVSSEDASLAWLGWATSTNSHQANVVLTNIQASMTVYAAFESAVEVAEITDSWDTIIANIDNGTYATKYKIGNYKPLDLGAEGIVNMQIVGLNKDALAAGSGNAKTSWISKELLNTSHKMNPARSGSSGAYDEGTGAIGGWEKTEMRMYLKDTIKPLIPSTVRSAIKEVTKYSRIYNTAGSAVNDVATTEDVWLPSKREITGADSNAETQGPIYSEAFPDNASRVKNKVGASDASWWWLRSTSGTKGFNDVSSDGNNNSNGASTVGALALGFCI